MPPTIRCTDAQVDALYHLMLSILVEEQARQDLFVAMSEMDRENLLPQEKYKQLTNSLADWAAYA